MFLSCLCSVEMLNNKLNAHRGFTPAAVAPLNAITPEQVIRHHRYKRKGSMGDRSPRYLTSDLYFISWYKEFYRAVVCFSLIIFIESGKVI
jgi:hypothetical protein